MKVPYKKPRDVKQPVAMLGKRAQGRHPGEAWRQMFVKLNQQEFHRLMRELRHKGIRVMSMPKIYDLLEKGM